MRVRYVLRAIAAGWLALAMSVAVRAEESVAAQLDSRMLLLGEVEARLDREEALSEQVGFAIEGDQSTRAARLIMGWVNGELADELAAEIELKPEQIQAKVKEFESTGVIPAFTEETARFNAEVLKALEQLVSEGDFSKEKMSVAYDQVRQFVPEQLALDETWWQMTVAGARFEGVCLECYPTSVEEYDAAQKRLAARFLRRAEIARQSAALFRLKDSVTLREEVRVMLEANSSTLSLDEAIDRVLREREWDRWRLLAYRERVRIADPRLQQAWEALLAEREKKIASIENYAVVLDLPY